ncbi:hypothetical protein Pcinc_013202 [Petrolisthes cinctipes]|uniref:Uncharacterized protein n=1 Tax=Petrolisthes cinctipes TaxID=88211 RepID=A0AAE1KSI4_PETCI|nr:hypothetical protein Pcinc_013202 [Petrolisthes cinctipes]
MESKKSASKKRVVGFIRLGSCCCDILLRIHPSPSPHPPTLLVACPHSWRSIHANRREVHSSLTIHSQGGVALPPNEVDEEGITCEERLKEDGDVKRREENRKLHSLHASFLLLTASNSPANQPARFPHHPSTTTPVSL